MSIRYEWVAVDHPFGGVQFMPAGHDVRTGLPADEETGDEDLVEEGALVVSYDEVVVLTGTPEQLRAWLKHALSLLPKEDES